MSDQKLIDKISSPDDLKKLTDKELNILCSEIREKLIETVSVNGGHLASNLGVVELTVAIHSVFNSPNDQIVFDVGHQCYTHKLLTGRAKDFNTLRRENGISGFPKPNESIHDPMIAGHSSTSISAACGLARAKTLKNESGYVIPIIGDGALSGGLAYEGLNNAGRSNDKMIVILNDNKMSISRNVGSMSRYLAVIRTKQSYLKFKGTLDRVVRKIPVIGKSLRKILYTSKITLKSLLYKSTLFEDMGFVYIGPIDGHDITLLKQSLLGAQKYNQPILLHVCTVKGKGYTHAERNPRAFHGISSFDIETGDPLASGISFSDVFGDELCTLARENSRICAVTAAMKSGTGLNRFSIEFMDRFFDVGIAEEHAITFCGGLAANGMKPVFAVYSSFLQRGYDQIIHDIAIQNLNVVFAVDRAGIVGEDGETHQGVFDSAFLNTVPNLTVFAPTYFDELRIMLGQAFSCEGPAAVRYPRGGESGIEPEGFEASDSSFDFFEKEDSQDLIISYGRCFSNAASASLSLAQKGINTSLLKINRIKPIDTGAVQYALKYKRIFFFEEGIKNGGVGEIFLNMLKENSYGGVFKLIAIDEFVPSSSVKSALKKYKLDPESMQEVVLGGNN